MEREREREGVRITKRVEFVKRPHTCACGEMYWKVKRKQMLQFVGQNTRLTRWLFSVNVILCMQVTMEIIGGSQNENHKALQTSQNIPFDMFCSLNARLDDVFHPQI